MKKQTKVLATCLLLVFATESNPEGQRVHPPPGQYQPPTPIGGPVAKISETRGGLSVDLDAFDSFGSSATVLGDLNNDGVVDIAVGAPGDGASSPSGGAVWVVFLNSNGTINSRQKIADGAGGFLDDLSQPGETDTCGFGSAVAGLGDLDGDSVEDLAVGASGFDDGGEDAGAVWILFLNVDGTVKSHQRISSTLGGFAGELDAHDEFGSSVAPLDDMDGDGVPELAVGATGDDDQFANSGAVWILFMNPDATVLTHQKISNLEGGMSGIAAEDAFGCSLANMGKLDGNGIDELAVGVRGDDDSASNAGAVSVLFLNADGTVQSHSKISATSGGFTGPLDADDNFGSSLANTGDLNGDGVQDLTVGAPGDDDSLGVGDDQGAIWIVFLASGGSATSAQKVSALQGLFGGTLSPDDRFGSSVTALGDIDGDNVPDLIVGSPGDDDLFRESGGVHLLFLDGDLPGGVKSHDKISPAVGGFTLSLLDNERFGNGVECIGDIDGDGIQDLAVGSWQAAFPCEDIGRVWILFLTANGNVRRAQRIGDGLGNFGTAFLDDCDAFGWDIAYLGDLDNDGFLEEIVVSAWKDDDGGTDRGAIYILSLDRSGIVKAHQKISDTVGGFEGVLDDGDWFGYSIANIGDLDNDGVPDLAVGARGDGSTGSGSGTLWILFLNANGTVKSEQKISDDYAGDFDGIFARGVAGLGDLNGDGTEDIAVGNRTKAVNTPGSVWVMFLNSDATVQSHAVLTSPFLRNSPLYGTSLQAVGDLDGDGVSELLVGDEHYQDGTAESRGGIELLYLNPDGTIKSAKNLWDYPFGNFPGRPGLNGGDGLGSGLGFLGDLNSDGVLDFAASARDDDDGGLNRGAVWIFFKFL